MVKVHLCKAAIHCVEVKRIEMIYLALALEQNKSAVPLHYYNVYYNIVKEKLIKRDQCWCCP